MNFIVEDGTGKTDANSYVDVSFADGYFNSKGASAWVALTEEQKQAALVNGTQYADLRYGYKLPGRPVNKDQALALPQSQLNDRFGDPVVGIPAQWKRAVCEYALLGVSKPLIPQPAQPAGVESKMIKVGPITTSYKYTSGSAVSFTPYPQADSLITNFFGPGVFSTGQVIRN